MRRLFDAVAKPTVSYGCEVWGPLCSGSLQPRLKGMAGLQIAFFRQLLKLRKSMSLHVIFAELAEALWQRTRRSQVLGFMHRLDSMDEGRLHPDVLSDNIHDALGNPTTGLLEFRSTLLVWASRLHHGHSFTKWPCS